MNVRDIRTKAKEVSTENRMILFRVVLILALILTVKDDLFGSNAIASLLLALLFLTFNHGVVVCALKIINNREEEFEFPKDTFIGVKRIKELFSTYFVHQFILFGITMILLVIMTVSALGEIGTALDMYVSGTTISADQLALFTPNIPVVLLIAVLLAAVTLYYTLNFDLTVYVLEKYNIKNLEAMKMSKKLMKGYKMLYFKLLLSFLLRLIGCVLVGTILTMIIGALSMSLVNIFVAIITVYFITVDLSLCTAVLFEEACITYHEEQGVI